MYGSLPDAVFLKVTILVKIISLIAKIKYVAGFRIFLLF